ncbi:hypothetical protein VSDG_06706 [Cytospora chrysosperma]|uniref:Carrier domain-containing protein n=1 Tax=Cytospora chrysosperma TaxID=252740 RepID=A0A423VNB8_CYTCH|nr:hypothetical protein VSDG_06706 [Valsa sordida]
MSGHTLPKIIFETGNNDAAAVVSPALNNRTLSRTELKQVSLDTADGIQAYRKRHAVGIEGRQVVAMALPNGLPFVLAFLGVTARGAIAAPLNPAYTVPEYEFYLSDTKAGVLVVDEPNAKDSFPGIVAARKLGIPVCSVDIEVKGGEGKELLCPIIKPVSQVDEGLDNGTTTKGVNGDADESIVDPTPDTLCLILHTSGTTGKPKAVPLSHANLACSALNVAASYNLGPQDRGYLIQVLFHIHGIVASLLAPLVSGGSVVVPNKFDAGSTWTEFAKLRCSWLSGTPSALQILLHAPGAGPGLGIKFLRSCSSPLLPSTFKTLQEVFQCPVLEAYAMTENAHQMTTNTMSDAQPGSVGKAAGTVRLAIFGDDLAAISPLPADSEGEVCITGPSVTKGYLENPDANSKAFFTDANGVRWFRTGDIGVLDTEGHLRIVGRRSEIINRGGEKISPLEVDEAMMLCAAPYIREAACFAVPDEFFHQEIEAAVVLEDGAPSHLRDEGNIQHLLEQRLAAFKIPKRIHFFDGKIPKGPTGKIQRNQLSKKLARPSGSSGNTAKQDGEDLSNLPERIRVIIAEALRIELATVQPETTLLELGADSMSLTRMLGSLRRLGSSIDMSDVILNPTVQQVTELCVKSYTASGSSSAPADNSAQQADIPAPFSVLKEVLEDEEGMPSLDVVLDDVAKQTGLQLDQLEEALPLSPEQKWYFDAAITPKWGLQDTQVSWITIGTLIKPTVDIERLKWAFTEVAKIEPMPRSFLAVVPGTDMWLHVVAKPGSVPLDWQQWSADSKQAALDRLQAEHEALRYKPGIRASKMVLVDYPGEGGETRHGLYMVESHVLTDNISRSMMRDNVIKLYLGQATIDDLPQVPLPSSGWIRALIRGSKDNRADRLRYWQSDSKSHAFTRRSDVERPEATIHAYTQYCINQDISSKTIIWKGDIKGLSVLMGMTAPTLIQAIMPLAQAAFEYQGTREVPKSVCYFYGISVRTVITPPIPNSEQLRGFGVAVSPFNSVLCLAQQSIWLHLQHASLKLADAVKHYHPQACGGSERAAPTFVWREVPHGSVWSNVIEDSPESFSVEVTSMTYVVAMRLGVDTIMMVDGERDEYVEWRKKNGYPVSLVAVLLRCLTFLCENKDDVASLTFDDLLKAVWA